MDSKKKPFIIAGPCSVESRDQLASVTGALAALPQVSLVRGGVWKPRTRPGGFEGLGEPALQWMRELSLRYGVSYCCEVARPEHVALCRQYGIGTVWIGARTTANPFMVDELCQELRGGAMRVLVKNPVSPDVRLWIGAIERLRQCGVGDIVAVHRGFSMYHNNGYRNAPLWEVAMEFRREMPDVPILCDPSHMGGRRDLVEQLAVAALQLDYDGLMVEVHPRPDEALTDNGQQITPDALADLLQHLASLFPHPDSERLSPPQLTALRSEMDEIDHSLLRMLGRRMELSRRIASVKREHKMAVYQSGRWADVVRDRLEMAASLGLDPAFTKELLEKIHAESVRVQMEK